MTTSLEQKLSIIIEDGSISKLKNFLKPLNDKDKKSLFPFIKERTYRLRGLVYRYSFNEKNPVELEKAQCQGKIASLALLHLTDTHHTKDFHLDYLDLFPCSTKELQDFYKDLTIPNLQRLVDQSISTTIGRLHWNRIRKLIDIGAAKPPEHENYYLSILQDSTDNRKAYHFLTENPDLLESTIWKLFEIEGNEQQSLAGADCGQSWLEDKERCEFTWAYAFKKLSEEGKISRSRLLKASLTALNRNFSQNRAGWFSRFHEFMKPSIDERIENAPYYITLLHSSINPTVTFAIRSLKIIQKSGHLPAKELINNVSPALTSKIKSTVVTAITLLKNIAEKDVSLRASVLKLCTQGLIHESTDVQEKIFSLLASYPETHDQELYQKLEDYYAIISPSLKKQLSIVLPEFTVKPIVETTELTDTRLTPSKLVSKKVKWIESYEELVEQAAFILENPICVLEVERVLEALFRFPNKLDDQKVPFTKRATKILQSYKRHWAEDPYFNACPIAYALLRWATPNQTPVEYAREGEKIVSIMRFHLRRFDRIADLLSQKPYLPLLSSPTYENLLISPSDLIERSLGWQKANQSLDLYDQIISLLRLSTEEKTFSRQQCNMVNGEWGDVLKYALNLNNTITGDTQSLWIAAARVRHPGESDDHLQKKWPNLGPGAAHLPKLTWKVTRKSHKCLDEILTSTHLIRTVTPEAPDTVPDEHLTILLNTEENIFDVRKTKKNDFYWLYYITEGELRWLLSYYPNGREALYAAGVKLLGEHWERITASDHPTFKLFDWMSDEKEKFGPNALMLLNLGLACEYLDGRLTAAHAFSNGISHQSLNPEKLGKSMQFFLEEQLISMGRLRKALDAVVHTSNIHARAVAQYIMTFLQLAPQKAPRDIGKILELFHELLVDLELKVEKTKCLNFLKAFSGTNKTAKLANKIISL